MLSVYCGVYQAVDRNDREQRAIELFDVLCESEEAQFTVICDALVRDGQQRIVDDFLRRNYYTHSLFTNDADVLWLRMYTNILIDAVHWLASPVKAISCKHR